MVVKSVEQRERERRIKEAEDVESTLRICVMGQPGVILNALLDVSIYSDSCFEHV